MTQPLLSLMEVFERDTLSVQIPNDVQTSPWEYGYSAAIIILAVVILESALNRAAYLRQEDIGKGAAEYFKRLVPDPQLGEAVSELFVVRDVIAHNHVWDGETVDDSAGLRFKTAPKLAGRYGDRKYRNYVDLASRQTRNLKINVFPTKLWRKDILTVLNNFYRALNELMKVDVRYFNTTDPAFLYHGRYVSFQSAIERLNKTLLGVY